MRRGALVVSLVLAAGTASAQPVLQGPVAHACAGPRRVVPADGATGVPTNAHVWVFGGRQDAYVLLDGPTEVIASTSYWASPPIMELRLRGLEPRRTYSVRTLAGERLTTFTTGDDAGTAENVAVWVTTREGNARRWQLFPAEDFASTFAACNQLAVPSAQPPCVEVRAVDITGHAGDIVTNCPASADAGAWRARNSSPFLLVLVALEPFAFALIVVAQRARDRRRRPAVPRAIVARVR